MTRIKPSVGIALLPRSRYYYERCEVSLVAPSSDARHLDGVLRGKTWSDGAKSCVASAASQGRYVGSLRRQMHRNDPCIEVYSESDQPEESRSQKPPGGTGFASPRSHSHISLRSSHSL